MKFLTIVLTTFILFLAVKPGMDLFSLQTDSWQTCCDGQCFPTSENENTPVPNNNNDGDDKSCNPFQVCSSCVLGFLNIPFDCIPKSSAFSEKAFPNQPVFTSQFASDVWQPPKIV